jgi:aminoglycoside phosphotransferase family enzyme/predicted kinase
VTPSAAVVETHTAVVLLMGDRAYKVKKPVDLGFLDFTSREARERDCHREVELNRRLAPDVYLGVADVHGTGGEPCEHLVVMRRLPADRRLDVLVTAGADVDDDLESLARLLAAFHAAQPRSPVADDAATAAAMRARWAANTHSMRRYGAGVFDPEALAALEWLPARYLAGRDRLFQSRIAAGRARDGHGDLQADDVFCLDDGPRVLDCLEFDAGLRCGDGLGDAAFLAMDLERLGRPDLAARFLAAYREHAADDWPASLAHHHIAYRAQVRAKVAAIRADQGDAAAVDRARRLLALALEHLEAARVRLLVVGGLPGTGKSTLAAGLARRLDAAHLRSDEVRKELAGIPTGQRAAAPFGHGIYGRASTAATYHAMLERARRLLAHGETVVLDASWHDPQWRQAAAHLADATSADLVELRCDAPVDVARNRLLERARRGTDASDADPDVLAAMSAAVVPWPSALDIDTDRPREAVLADAMRALAAAGRSAAA